MKKKMINFMKANLNSQVITEKTRKLEILIRIEPKIQEKIFQMIKAFLSNYSVYKGKQKVVYFFMYGKEIAILVLWLASILFFYFKKCREDRTFFLSALNLIKE